jgi:excisionase family DNA binding protein
MPHDPSALVDGRSERAWPTTQTYDPCELLTVADIATLLKVSKSWVYERTRARSSAAGERLPHIKLGRYVRFDRRFVEAFLERCRTT